jgi:hypothetical protein
LVKLSSEALVEVAEELQLAGRADKKEMLTDLTGYAALGNKWKALQDLWASTLSGLPDALRTDFEKALLTKVGPQLSEGKELVSQSSCD